VTEKLLFLNLEMLLLQISLLDFGTNSQPSVLSSNIYFIFFSNIVL